MSEQPTEEPKVYPGSIERYRELRKQREFIAKNAESEDAPGDSQAYFAAVLAEEIAGLAYILDGIRYSARAK